MFTEFALVFLVLVAALVFMGVKIVPQGHQYTVEYFGRYTKTLEPGLALIFPVIQKIGYRVNMKEQVVDIEPQSVITADNANVTVDGVVFYQIFDAAKSVYEVNDLTRGILNITMTNLRSVCGGFELDELLSKRDEIGDRILTIVDDATNSWGVKVLRVEIKDIDPPAELIHAMNQQMTAERSKRAQVTEAEGSRQSAILKAEGEKSAAFLLAEAREREAEAEAKATKMVSEAVAEGDPQALNYFIGLKYVETMGRFADSNNQKTVFMPMDMTSLVGTIGGITELWKDLNPKP
ncbi:MAG: SPFH/Band 7/PHB domain protein [Thiotrichaceae bacterium]|nr:SPFH/Band 7/PHB domain protein [Thiotrichaceae bacterium]